MVISLFWKVVHEHWKKSFFPRSEWFEVGELYLIVRSQPLSVPFSSRISLCCHLFLSSWHNLRLFQPLSFCQACLNLANEFKSHGEDKVLERQISTQTAKSLWKTDMKTIPHYKRKGCLGLWSSVMDLPEHVICLGNSFTEVGFYEILWS